MVKVFFSYSHDNTTHRANVHALAERLKSEQGLKVVLDKDAGPGGPNEGWPAWSQRQVREADRVLIACSREYCERYEGRDDNSERGRGTVIEARTIQQFLYDSKGKNARFRVVLFDAAHEEHIPLQLRAYHYFDLANEFMYGTLVEWLKGGVSDADALPPQGPVWPEPDLDFQLPLADRRPHFDALRSGLSGKSSNRIFLLHGEGAAGKTEFLHELSTYADRLRVPWTLFDFKGTRPFEEFFEAVVVDLGKEVLPDTAAARSKAPFAEFVTDLQCLTTPVLLMFDTFEKASEQGKEWLEVKFLQRLRLLPAVIVVVGGRVVPDRKQFVWRSLAESRVLEPIRNPEDWKEYLERVHNRRFELHEIQLLTDAALGQPAVLKPLLENLISQRS